MLKITGRRRSGPDQPASVAAAPVDFVVMRRLGVVAMIVNAIVVDGRIQLDIRKGDEGYDVVASVLDAIETSGYMSWYGDIRRDDGVETSGLVITSRPAA